MTWTTNSRVPTATIFPRIRCHRTFLTMAAWTLQLRGLLTLSKSSHLTHSHKVLLRTCVAHQTRSFSLEALTTPFNRKELRAAAAGTPDLSSDYHLVYIGALARRIATYKIGAFILSACGLAVAPIVLATAQVPLMALPGLTHSNSVIEFSRASILSAASRVPLFD